MAHTRRILLHVYAPRQNRLAKNPASAAGLRKAMTRKMPGLAQSVTQAQRDDLHSAVTPLDVKKTVLNSSFWLLYSKKQKS